MKISSDLRLQRPVVQTSPAEVSKASPSANRIAAPVDQFEASPAEPQLPAPAPLPATPIEVLYTDPFHQDTMGDRFAQVVDGAQGTIDGAFYEIADERMVGAFCRAAERGVKVRLVTDDNYFRTGDTQEVLDRSVSTLAPVHAYLLELRRLKTTDPALTEKAADLLARLAPLEQLVAGTELPEDVAVSLAPVRTYLTALTERRPIDETLLWQQKNAFAVQSAVASDFGEVKIRDLFRPAYDQLLASGVQLRDDDASDLSHNKYMVVDAKTVWMGSYNLQGLKSDDGSNLGEPMTADNAVVLSSPTLAAPFLADFKQMFEEGRFHGDKSEISGRTVTIHGVKVTPYFAPKDPIIANITADLGTLLNRMRAARASGHPMTPPPTIRVAGFAMSYNGTEAMVDMLSLLHREGADVQVISDGLSAGSSTSSVKALRERGVPVMVTDAKVMMHHKFLSVEAGRENYVFTGSANFTHPAYFDNDESVLRLESQKTALAYRAIFDSLRDDIREDKLFKTSTGIAEISEETPPAWTELDPAAIHTLQDAERYARARWGL